MSTIRHISEYIYEKSRKLAHIYFVVFAFMGNLVPITIDMVTGRHIELNKMATVKINKLS